MNGHPIKAVLTARLAPTRPLRPHDRMSRIWGHRRHETSKRNTAFFLDPMTSKQLYSGGLMAVQGIAS